MLIVPARKVEEAEGGIACVLGSEPGPGAARQFLPSECVVGMVGAQGSDLAVLTLDESKLPEGVRRGLGLR